MIREELNRLGHTIRIFVYAAQPPRHAEIINGAPKTDTVPQTQTKRGLEEAHQYCMNLRRLT